MTAAANLTTSVWEQYGGGPWTFVAMVQRPTSGAGVIFDNLDGYSPPYGYQLVVDATGKIQGTAKGPSIGGFTESAAGTLADGETAIIAAQWDNAGTLRLFKNGTQVSTATLPAGQLQFTGAGDRRASFFDPDRPGAGYQAGNMVVFGALWYSSLLTTTDLSTFGTSQANALAGSFYTAAFNGLVAAPSSATITLTLADAQFAGSASQQTGSLVTYPFARNNGFSPVSLSNNALAVLSDDANLTRIAGSTAVTMSAGGTLSYSAAGIAAGTTYLVVTREADGKLGIERYTAT